MVLPLVVHGASLPRQGLLRRVRGIVMGGAARLFIPVRRVGVDPVVGAGVAVGRPHGCGRGHHVGRRRGGRGRRGRGRRRRGRRLHLGRAVGPHCADGERWLVPWVGGGVQGRAAREGDEDARDVAGRLDAVVVFVVVRSRLGIHYQEQLNPPLLLSRTHPALPRSAPTPRGAPRSPTPSAGAGLAAAASAPRPP